MTKKSIIISCILLLIFLSIGFSSFQKELNIDNIDSIVRLQSDIRVTNINVNNTTNNAESLNEEYNVNNITSTVYLPSSSSTITYQIQISNYGNIEESISSIDEVYKVYNDGISETNSNLEIKNMTYTLKDKLCDDQDSTQCKLGSTTTFNITIGYKENGFDGNYNHYIRLDFNFDRVFNISYVGFNNTNNYPTTILEGETKTITFTNDIPIYLSVNNADANYNSPNLVLSNAVNDIVISYMCMITYTNITTANLQTQIVRGNDLNIMFNDNDILSLDIVMNNVNLVLGTDYTFTNNNLIINDVTGNINITANKPVTPNYNIILTETNNGTETNTTNLNLSVTDYTNQVFSFTNNTGRVIDSVRLEIVYSKSNSGNTANQYLVAKLTYDGIPHSTSQVTIPKQSATNQTLLLGEFNNLNISGNTNVSFTIDLQDSNFSSTNITIISQTTTVTYAS